MANKVTDQPMADLEIDLGEETWEDHFITKEEHNKLVHQYVVD